jgi:hypothetical protein
MVNQNESKDVQGVGIEEAGARIGIAKHGFIKSLLVSILPWYRKQQSTLIPIDALDRFIWAYGRGLIYYEPKSNDCWAANEVKSFIRFGSPSQEELAGLFSKDPGHFTRGQQE